MITPRGRLVYKADCSTRDGAPVSTPSAHRGLSRLKQTPAGPLASSWQSVGYTQQRCDKLLWFSKPSEARDMSPDDFGRPLAERADGLAHAACVISPAGEAKKPTDASMEQLARHSHHHHHHCDWSACNKAGGLYTCALTRCATYIVQPDNCLRRWCGARGEKKNSNLHRARPMWSSSITSLEKV
jgi:hypothetical protein